MPLFFFHLRGPEGLGCDEDGLELPDLDTAYLEACRSIPAMTAELQQQHRDPLRYAFVLADVEGRDLMDVPFDELTRRHRPRSAATSSAIAKWERAVNLFADVREQHEQLHANMVRMRALLRGEKPPGEGS